MPVQVITPLGVLPEADASFKAGRVSQRPAEAVGACRVSKFSGLLPAGLAANADVFQIRNPDANKLIILQYLKIKAVVITGFTAAQELAFSALHVRNWATATATGTQILVNNNNLKKRTALAASIADARIAAAAAMTAPAAPAVIDTESFLSAIGKTLAAAATVPDAIFEETFDATSGAEYPMVYAQNEGLTVRNQIALGAAGTVRLAVTASWIENPTY